VNEFKDKKITANKHTQKMWSEILAETPDTGTLASQKSYQGAYREFATKLDIKVDDSTFKDPKSAAELIKNIEAKMDDAGFGAITGRYVAGDKVSYTEIDKILKDYN
jgi:hypothetical protein